MVAKAISCPFLCLALHLVHIFLIGDVSLAVAKVHGVEAADRAARAAAKLRSSLRSSDSKRFLLVNVFEEQCFNPGKDEVNYDQFRSFAHTSETPRLWDEQTMRSTYEYSLAPKKQRFKSCGQFNNVLHLLQHALAVARALNRTLVLPGFYFRKGILMLCL